MNINIYSHQNTVELVPFQRYFVDTPTLKNTFDRIANACLSFFAHIYFVLS